MNFSKTLLAGFVALNVLSQPAFAMPNNGGIDIEVEVDVDPTLRNRQTQEATSDADSSSNSAVSNVGNISSPLLIDNAQHTHLDLQPQAIVYAGQCDRAGFSVGLQQYHGEGQNIYAPQLQFNMPIGPNTCDRANQLATDVQLAQACLALIGRVDFFAIGGDLARCPAILGLAPVTP